MDDPGSIWNIVLIIILVGVNAFFAMSEIAIISLNDTKLHHDADEGDKKAQQLYRLTAEPNRFLATIQVAITLSGFLNSAVAADNYAEPLSVWLSAYVPIARDTLQSIVLFLLTCLLSYFTLVFGELVPKRIAMQDPEKVSYAVVGVLVFFYKVLKAFVLMLNASTNGVLRLIGIDPNTEPEQVTEENIRMMLDAGNEKGVIEESEREMINNIFEFDDRTVGEVMTHRTEMTAVELDEDIKDVVEVAIADGYSRIPVYDDTIDDIKGVIYAKDLLALIGDKGFKGRKVEDFLRPVCFVPESNSCREVFKQFQQEKIQLAIVVDEYGGTAGLISMEDLIESVMGNIQDEYDNEEEEISKIDEDNFDFEGSVQLEDITELLGITLPDEDADYDTLGGLIIDILGRIPDEDEHPTVTVDNVEFTVTAMEEHRIARVHAHILPKPEADEEDGGEADEEPEKEREKEKE